jgi:hypothetical protein
MWGIISVDKSPIFSRFKPRSVTQYGREQMSMTALERALAE